MRQRGPVIWGPQHEAVASPGMISAAYRPVLQGVSDAGTPIGLTASRGVLGLPGVSLRCRQLAVSCVLVCRLGPSAERAKHPAAG